MRELKFRAMLEVDTVEGSGIEEMVYFTPCQCDNGMWFNPAGHIQHINEYLSPFEQFTGLKDKNGEGNDVFEGDLFNVVFSNVPNGFQPMGFKEKQNNVIGEVVFKWGGFYVKIMHPERKEYVFSELRGFLENEQKVVIGNIHQNPELLTN